jgi:indole-3-glycerol phosphate synthase
MLEQIVAQKQREVSERKALYPVKLLERSIYFETPCVSLCEYLDRPDKVGIIAEIKRRSPSKGFFAKHINVPQLSVSYMQGGASALSILTDTEFFGGSNDDLTRARINNFCPILRKDFTIDEYQVLEAKSIGADAILLIAAILTPHEVRALAQQARALGLESILEVHTLAEIDSHSCPEVHCIGVNNRNLSTFTVSVETSEQLVSHIPPEFTAIAESGISEAHTINHLKRLGYSGFLIGEAFMRSDDPGAACRTLVKSVRMGE